MTFFLFGDRIINVHVDKEFHNSSYQEGTGSVYSNCSLEAWKEMETYLHVYVGSPTPNTLPQNFVGLL